MLFINIYNYVINIIVSVLTANSISMRQVYMTNKHGKER